MVFVNVLRLCFGIFCAVIMLACCDSFFPTESRFRGVYLFKLREKPFHSEEVDFFSSVDGAVFFLPTNLRSSNVEPM